MLGSGGTTETKTMEWSGKGVGEERRGMLGKGNLGERIGGVGTGTPVIEGMLMFEGGD